jgi:hypothetical protein
MSAERPIVRGVILEVLGFSGRASRKGITMEHHGRTRSTAGTAVRLPPALGDSVGSDRPHPLDSTATHPLAGSEFQEMQRRLRSMFGAAGSELLYRRSVIRAATRHPVLRGVSPMASADDLVQTLQSEAAGQGEVGAAALRAIIAEQRSLLVRLIGEDLLGVVLPGSIEQPRSTEADRKPHADE